MATRFLVLALIVCLASAEQMAKSHKKSILGIKTSAEAEALYLNKVQNGAAAKAFSDQSDAEKMLTAMIEKHETVNAAAKANQVIDALTAMETQEAVKSSLEDRIVAHDAMNDKNKEAHMNSLESMIEESHQLAAEHYARIYAAKARKINSGGGVDEEVADAPAAEGNNTVLLSQKSSVHHHTSKHHSHHSSVHHSSKHHKKWYSSA